jgi:adenylate kinase
MASFIVLLGPPGVGKGTQAAIVANKTRLPHISSGDLFRENMKNHTDLGKKVQSYMDKGELVPDDLTIAMVAARLSRADCRDGAILDGFPRTPIQAEALQKMLAKVPADVSLVPYITAAPQVLIARASGRWTCKAQGHVYHEKFSPPKVAGKCDVDGSDLFQREDDKAQTVANRIRVYLEQTAPLVEYYRARHKLVEIDGAQSIDQVTVALLAAIGSTA